MLADYANITDNGWDLKNVKKYNITKEGVFTNIENIDTVPIYDKQTSDKVFNLMVNSLKRDREFTNLAHNLTPRLRSFAEIEHANSLGRQGNFKGAFRKIPLFAGYALERALARRAYPRSLSLGERAIEERHIPLAELLDENFRIR